MTTPSLNRARNAWGDQMPLWVRLLSEACDRTSQRKAADQIEYSPAVINQVLNNTYKGDMASVEDRVRAVLMADELQCPAIASVIELATCLEHQKHAKQGNRSSAFRVTMSRACPKCPHSRIGEQ